jgi:tetratricopeptide (TPR) repeat protein
LHRRIAETLCEAFPAIAAAEPEIVGHHFAQAGLSAAAIEWWSRAAEGARERSAYREAIAHYANAIALAETVPDAPDQRLSRFQLQIAYGQALIAAHSHGAPVTTAAFDRAGELASAIEDPSERARAYYGLWAGRHVRGESAEARALADAFLRDVERDPVSPEAGLAHRALGTTRWTEGNFADARRHLERALALSETPRDADLRSRFGLDPKVAAMMQLALVAWQTGEVVRGRELAAAGLRLAIESRHVPTLVYGHGWTCFFEAARGDGARVLPSATSLLALSAEHRLSLWQSFGTFFLDWGRWRIGDRDAGLKRMREAVTSFRNEGLTLYLTFYPVLLAEAEAETGEHEAAWTTLAEALDVAERTGQRWFSADAHRQRGRLIVARAGPEMAHAHCAHPAAEAAFVHAIAIAREQEARVAEVRAAFALSRLHGMAGKGA